MFRRLREIYRRSSAPGVSYPPELAFMLRLPLRRLILSPAEMVRRLAPRPDDCVLELGPGPGYFSLEVARALPRGRLLLLDLQPAMLVKLEQRLTRAGVSNATLCAADAVALPLAEASVDLAFLVAVLGEVPDPPRAMAELFRVIRPGGRLHLAEQPGDPDFIPRPAVTAMALVAGFRAGRFWGRARSYGAEFLRP